MPLIPDDFPSIRFSNSPIWDEALWIGTTFQWHPTSAAPPIMGLVFADIERGRALFREWVDRCGNHDRLEEIRIAVIEGDIPGMEPGYSVFICPDPVNVLARATMMGIAAESETFGGRTVRMHPISDAPPLLPRFKQEYDRHRQFLLAPATAVRQGQLYVEVPLGIEKSVIHFRNVNEITSKQDIDSAVLMPIETDEAPR